MISEEEMIKMQKKYSGLWHIEDPYDKAIETVKFLRMTCIIRDDEYVAGYMDALKKAEAALKDLKELEAKRSS